MRRRPSSRPISGVRAWSGRARMARVCHMRRSLSIGGERHGLTGAAVLAVTLRSGDGGLHTLAGSP